MNLPNSIRFLVALSFFTIPLQFSLGLGVEDGPSQFDSRNQEIGFKMAKTPPFPNALLRQGIYSGSATVAVEVDEKGRLKDWLVVQASDDAFEESIASVIRKWKFSPAFSGGQAIRSVREVSLQFDGRGTREEQGLVTASSAVGSSYFGAALQPVSVMEGTSLEFAHPSQLDQPIALLESVRPELPEDVMVRSKGAEVVYEFYIDSHGNVHLPRLKEVRGDLHPEAIPAGAEALKQWHFAPITKRGRPAVTFVSQTIFFNHLY